jgi:hypothetical protein
MKCPHGWRKFSVGSKQQKHSPILHFYYENGCVAYERTPRPLAKRTFAIDMQCQNVLYLMVENKNGNCFFRGCRTTILSGIHNNYVCSHQFVGNARFVSRVVCRCDVVYHSVYLVCYVVCFPVEKCDKKTKCCGMRRRKTP